MPFGGLGTMRGALGGGMENLGKFLAQKGGSMKEFASPLSPGGVAGHGIGMLGAAGKKMAEHPFATAGAAGLGGMTMGELGDDEVDQEDEIAQLLRALGLV